MIHGKWLYFKLGINNYTAKTILIPVASIPQIWFHAISESSFSLRFGLLSPFKKKVF